MLNHLRTQLNLNTVSLPIYWWVVDYISCPRMLRKCPSFVHKDHRLKGKIGCVVLFMVSSLLYSVKSLFLNKFILWGIIQSNISSLLELIILVNMATKRNNTNLRTILRYVLYLSVSNLQYIYSTKCIWKL